VSAAAGARRFVAEHDLADRVAKVAADAPEITPPQLDALRAIWLAPNMTKTRPERVSVPDHGCSRDHGQG
jgi:hypothetical protein